MKNIQNKTNFEIIDSPGNNKVNTLGSLSDLQKNIFHQV